MTKDLIAELKQHDASLNDAELVQIFCHFVDALSDERYLRLWLHTSGRYYQEEFKI